jgi:hypothetical protein
MGNGALRVTVAHNYNPVIIVALQWLYLVRALTRVIYLSFTTAAHDHSHFQI